MTNLKYFYSKIKVRIFNRQFFKSGFIFIAIFIFSLLISILSLEIFTRIFLQASDAPNIYFDKHLGNLFIPYQKGIFVKGKNSEIIAMYNINNKGWNSPYDYEYKKPKDTLRIIVIGDSYVEALQVDYNKSYPYLLEKLIKVNSDYKGEVQVYTFGHSGANLFHYQNIFQDVLRKYNPDFVVFNIVLNDYKESFYGLSRKDNWSLVYKDNKFEEIAPKEVSNLSLKRILKNSAIVRYLTINLDLINTSPIFYKLFYAETRSYNEVNSNKRIENPTMSKMIYFVLSNIQKQSQTSEVETLFVVDTDKEKIYQNNTSFSNFYTEETGRIAKDLGIPVFNLKAVFKDDWGENHKRFNFEFDEHWNEYGHKVVAEQLYKFLIDNQLLIDDLVQNN